MRRSSWYALMVVALAGWSIAGAIAWLLLASLGWFGLMLLGLAVLVVALHAELNEDYPSASRPSVHIMRRQLEQHSEGPPEARLERWAERLERHRWLYIARTVGIALALLGLNMFALHGRVGAIVRISIGPRARARSASSEGPSKLGPYE